MFFARAENLERITPPWLHFRLLGPDQIQMGAETRIEYRLRLHGIPLIWVSRIEVWEQGRRFVDRQVRGPFRLWRHQHDFVAVPSGTRVRDVVEFVLPGGRLGQRVGMPFVARDLRRIFDYRQDAVNRLLR